MMHHNTAYRIAFGLALLAAFLIVWMNLAVGIIGEPDDLANLMYAGVLAIGAVGAIIARFQPEGMKHTMFAMAGAQLLLTAITLIAQLGIPPGKPQWILVVNGLFFALFAGSALMFRRAQSGEDDSAIAPNI
jgi:peptidoglycan/LPS O-acetylase OafA/YrhL